MPSTAAAMLLPCPRAPNAAAIARAKPAVITDQRMISARSGPPTTSWACSGENTPSARIIIVTDKKSPFLTAPPVKTLVNDPPTSNLSRCPFSVFVLFVLRRHRAAEVDHRQQDENEGLQRRGDNPKEHHRQRNNERNDAEQDQDDELFAKDVSEQAQRQRHHTREMADQLDDQHQRRQEHGGARRHREMLEVLDD